MKNLFFPFYILFIPVLFMLGCDKIEEPYLRNQGNSGNDTNLQLPRKAFLEVFTGHLYPGYPIAGEILKDLADMHNDRLVVMSVHAGPMAEPDGGIYTADFTTPAGDELDAFYGISATGNPAGMVSRTGGDSAHILAPEDWEQKICSILEVSAGACIVITNDFNADEGTLSVGIVTTFLAYLEGIYNLSVFITEDSIIAPQKNDDPLLGDVPDIEDFVHMHVLRTAVNGTWGEVLNSDDHAHPGERFTKSYQGIPVNITWKADRCHVVAVVYNTLTGEVIQAESRVLTDNYVAPVRKVLLEDYTGHKCVNCPGAAVISRDLEEQYDGQVVLLAVHAGWFAQPSAGGLYTMDFTTDEGDELDTFFGISVLGNPKGMVNRMGEGTARVLNPQDWASKVGEALSHMPDASLRITTDYHQSSHALSTGVTVTFLNTLRGIYRVCTFIAEDSIVAPQMNNDPTIGPTPDIEDYVHMHVLRGSFSGTWGEGLNTGNIVPGVPYTVSYSNLALDPGWKEKHLSVVAFVYDAVTYEVIQAEKVYVQE
ncbi:MAG: Omp28-related outer membrane protein [Bacteroidales bacterium]|nr:Omp28-related outer membrane protein [Bacteroidales bacterium]